MGLALELFLLLLFVIAGTGALALFFTRDVWKRLWNNIVKMDSAENAVLQERKVETEQRIRAERELEECLGEDTRYSEGVNPNTKTHQEWSRRASPLEAKNETIIRKTDDER